MRLLATRDDAVYMAFFDAFDNLFRAAGFDYFALSDFIPRSQPIPDDGLLVSPTPSAYVYFRSYEDNPDNARDWIGGSHISIKSAATAFQVTDESFAEQLERNGYYHYISDELGTFVNVYDLAAAYIGKFGVAHFSNYTPRDFLAEDASRLLLSSDWAFMCAPDEARAIADDFLELSQVTLTIAQHLQRTTDWHFDPTLSDDALTLPPREFVALLATRWGDDFVECYMAVSDSLREAGIDVRALINKTPRRSKDGTT